MACQGPPDLLVMNKRLFTSIQNSLLFWFVFVSLLLHLFVLTQLWILYITVQRWCDSTQVHALTAGESCTSPQCWILNKLSNSQFPFWPVIPSNSKIKIKIKIKAAKNRLLDADCYTNFCHHLITSLKSKVQVVVSLRIELVGFDPRHVTRDTYLSWEI